MAFGFNFKKSENENVKPNQGLQNNDEGMLTEEELNNVVAYNQYPYGYPEELKKNENDMDEAIPRRRR